MSIEIVKQVRTKTGLPLKDIKKAIETLQTDNVDDIIKYLREQGFIKQQSRQGRDTSQGGVFSYVHESRIGVMIVLNCETDFVSRSEIFKSFANDVCLHITAYQPRFISEDQISEDFITSELDIARQQLLNDGKPEDKIEMILAGKKSKIAKDNSLLSQPFLKDTTRTVGEVLAELIQTTGELITVSKFTLITLND